DRIVQVRDAALRRELAVVERQREAFCEAARREHDTDGVRLALLVPQQLVAAADTAVRVLDLRVRAARPGRIAPRVRPAADRAEAAGLARARVEQLLRRRRADVGRLRC